MAEWPVRVLLILLLCAGVSGCAALNPFTKASQPDKKDPGIKEEDLSKDRSTGSDKLGSPAAPPVTVGPLVPVIPPDQRSPRRLAWPKKKTQSGSQPSD